MPAFRTPIDIGNRALQHCGAQRMDDTAGFTENSANASEIAFAYDKVREAELRRNTWKFAVRRHALRPIDVTTMLLQPTLYSAQTTYFRGCIVADETNNLWRSRIASNLNNDPQNSLTWEPYFGPLSVYPWDTTGQTAYFNGELVYTAVGDGTYRVYESLVDANSDNPGTATAWSATSTYNTNDVVTRTSVAYMSLINLNTNQDPATAPALWSSVTTYAAGNKVGGSDGVIYQSVTNGNIGNDPTVDVTHTNWTNTGVLNPWTTVFVGGTGSVNWRQIGGAEFPMGVALTTIDIVYPLGTGPVSNLTSRNVYMLPARYLCLAQQNPGAGVPSWLGGPTGNNYTDWAFESGYLLTSNSQPIIFRYVADFTDVTRMDAMFCEGLAARLAVEVVERLTQSTAKRSLLAKIYDRWMYEARMKDAIEEQAQEPPDDDFIAVRI